MIITVVMKTGHIQAVIYDQLHCSLLDIYNVVVNLTTSKFISTNPYYS